MPNKSWSGVLANHLILIGASVRAAAWSALRAGFTPWCVDLFGDVDLCRVAANHCRIADYPRGFWPALSDAPDAPWLFTGGLENHPRLVEKISRRFPLWGNGPEVLRKIRSPFLVEQSLRNEGIRCPDVRTAPPAAADTRRWLVKPYSGAGGRGIRFARPDRPAPRSHFYQEWIDGESTAGLFVGHADGTCRLLGVTRQLVGEAWLHARPFCYCGSIGPLPLSATERDYYERIGSVLVRDFGLRGLFGVDCVLRGGVPWPVEVNPRYTASAELLEWANGEPIVACHARAFASGSSSEFLRISLRERFLGKAIFHAERPRTFPHSGPWMRDLDGEWQPWIVPGFADIPAAGQSFMVGQPILTIYARGRSVEECGQELRRRAQELDSRFQ